MRTLIITIPYIVLLAMPTIGFCQVSETEIRGTIVDDQTNEALPFVSILIEGTTLGTASNLDGEFALLIPEQFAQNTILFNFLGYETKKLKLNELNQEVNTVVLTAYAKELATVEVRPMSAETYLKYCVDKIPQNYPESFGGNIYFRQNLLDKNNTLQTSEGLAKAFLPKYLDTAKVQLRMLLFENDSDMGQLNFNKRKRDKKMEKARKKSIKKNKDFDEAAAHEKVSVFVNDIMTPDVLIEEDPIRKLAYFLDSTYFEEFNYSFEDESRYLDKKISVVSFSSKRNTKTQESSLKSNQKGFIYIDQESDAIVGIDYKGDYSIPAVFKPILFLAGISIKNPNLHKKVRYAVYNGKWYPQSIQFNLNVDITRRYWFKKNETSQIDSEIMMTVQDLRFERLSQIDERFRFKTNKPVEEQVYPLEDTNWQKINRISRR